MMQRMPTVRRVAAVVTLLALAGGCARNVPPASPGPPRYPDYLFPTVPEFLAASPAAARHSEGWQFLQAGNLEGAGGSFAAALESVADFYPAEAGLAYVDLARRRFDGALARFDRIVTNRPSYAPAWVGRGDVLLASEREAEALVAYESGLSVDPGLNDVRRRVEVLRFRAVQQAVTLAQQAHEAGQYREAQVAYEQALEVSPESGFLYRDLAAVERDLGQLGQALEHVRRANELEPDDAVSLVLQGEIHETLGDLEGAEAAYARAERTDPSEEGSARLERIRARIALARLPPAYRSIPDTPQISRSELASLIGIRLEALLERAPRDETILITDTRGHWADEWMLAVSHAGVMEVFANHTFQPAAVVQRGELAQVVSRVVGIIAAGDPARGRRWQNARYAFSDLEPGHLQYPAASVAVAAGVLPVLDGNTFQLTRAVSGAEAIAAIARLEQLLTQGA